MSSKSHRSGTRSEACGRRFWCRLRKCRSADSVLQFLAPLYAVITLLFFPFRFNIPQPLVKFDVSGHPFVGVQRHRSHPHALGLLFRAGDQLPPQPLSLICRMNRYIVQQKMPGLRDKDKDPGNSHPIHQNENEMLLNNFPLIFQHRPGWFADPTNVVAIGRIHTSCDSRHVFKTCRADF